jgi:hypothetical protein
MSRAGAVEETGGEEGIGEENTLGKINTQNGGRIFLQSRAAQGWDQSQRKNHARSKAIGREEKIWETISFSGMACNRKKQSARRR